jgi:hypothetical protein
MKKFGRDSTKEMSVAAPNYMAILAIVSEMARHVNENIAKVDLKPLQQVLSGRKAADTVSSNS